MYGRIFRSRRTVLTWMLAALTALVLGQVLGLLLGGTEPAPEPAAPEPQEPVLVTGTVIRREQVIYAPELGLWHCVLDGGEKAASGETLFTSGESGAAARLAKRLSQLQQGLSYSEMPLPERREKIHEAIAELCSGTGDGQTLTALLLGEGGVSPSDVQAAEEALRRAAAAEVQRLTAPEAGIFVPVVDGLETVLTPETPETGWADLPAKPVPALALGRLITSDSWYFSAEVPFPVEVGQTLQAELLCGIFEGCTLTAVEAEPSGSGARVLFSARDCLAQVAFLRTLTVKILSE